MDKKSIAAAKRASIRRDRLRYSRRSRGGSAAGFRSSPGSEGLWDGFEEVLPLEDVDIEASGVRSKGLDYGELLAQDPFFGYTALPPRSSEVLDDAIADIFSYDDSEGTNLAEFLALDLDKLGEHLASVSLAKRLFIEEDGALPSELFAGDEEQQVSEDEEASTRGEEHQVSGLENVDERKEWLKNVVNDPEGGEPVELSADDDEVETPGVSSGLEASEKRVAEDELDSLLDLLGKVTIELGKDGGSRDLVMNIDAPEDDERVESSGGEQHLHGSGSSSLMPREELELLFWSPDSTSETKRSEASAPAPAPAPAPTPAQTEDDFDVWLDSLDD